MITRVFIHNERDRQMRLTTASPTFILGMNGSGTTMLADCLGKHSELFSIPYETKVIPFHLANLHRFGDMRTIEARRALAAQIGATKAFWLANHRRNIELGDDELSEPSFAGVIDALFARLARGTGKRRWVEKSPQNLGRVNEIAAAFPDARFVHIIRDGRDCAQSLHRRWKYEPVVSIYRWRRLVELGRRAGAEIGPARYLEIRYEELTTDPQRIMTAVCVFLGVAFEPQVLLASMRTANPGVVAAGAIVGNSERWRRYFPLRTVKAMERTSGDFLAELGYPVDLRGERNPAAWRRAYSKLIGRATGALDRIRSHGWAAVPVLWRAMRVSRMQDSVDRSR